MLSVEEYLTKVVSLAGILPVELCPISEGFGRVLGEDLVAHCAVPPFDNSSMDGFAVRAADTAGGNVELRVVGDIAAGASSTPVVSRMTAARIMTGAPVPEGADAIVPVEETDQPLGDAPLPKVVTVGETKLGRFVRRAGEDVAVGATVLQAGASWSPAAAAAAASIGYSHVQLRRRPRVAVLSTGSELVAPGEELGFGQIPDSNSVLLTGLIEKFGGETVLSRAVPDDADAFRAALEEASEADLIITSGGVSVGAFEVVRQVTEGSIEFVKVAMQPGKPQACGLLSEVSSGPRAILALPGNPVSVFVSAWVFLRPLLAAYQVIESPWQSLLLPAREGWQSPPGRRQYIPVIVDEGEVTPAHALGSGSHLIASLHRANALAEVPAETEIVNPGDIVTVRLLGDASSIPALARK